MSEPFGWRGGVFGQGRRPSAWPVARRGDLSSELAERQQRLRYVGDTTRAAMDELSSVFSQAVDQLTLARCNVPAAPESGVGGEVDARDAWYCTLEDLSRSYVAQASRLVRMSAATLSMMAIDPAERARAVEEVWSSRRADGERGADEQGVEQ